MRLLVLLIIQAIIIFWQTALVMSVDDTETLLQARCRDVSVDAKEGCKGYVSAEEVDNGSVAGDQIAFISLNQTVFEGTGSFPVELCVEDVNGNVDTCEATVTVKDTYHCVEEGWIALGVILIVGVPLLLVGLCIWWWCCRRRQGRFRRTEDLRRTEGGFQPPARPEERVEPRREEPLDDQFLLERLARLEESLPTRRPWEHRPETPPMVKGEDVIIIPPRDVLLPAEVSAPIGEDATAPYEDASIFVDVKDVTPLPPPYKNE